MENKKNVTVGIFKTHHEAEEAVKELQKAGIAMNELSIVGRDYHSEEDVVGYYNSGERMKYWGKQGAFWGGIWGLFFGSAFFWIPAVGPLIVAGPLVLLIVAGLEGAVIVGSVSALSAGLLSLGIPEDSVITYEAAIKAGSFVIIAHGTSAETQKAREVITNLSNERLDLF